MILTSEVFEEIKTDVTGKALLNNKASDIWYKILRLLDAAAPLIFEGGPLKWYQWRRMYKLALLLVEFILELKQK